MKNRRVFIGWSGEDNRVIAQKISSHLREENYSPIIGGEWKTSFSVSEEIMHQMNGCDFGIFLIEKEIRKNDKKIISIGFNPNVMMELGYMLRKVSDYNRVRRFLINASPNELPSDLQGTWTDEIKKFTYPNGDSEARELILSDVANEIANKFFEYMKSFKGTDKLDYFDSWEENKFDIYSFTGDVRIGEKLIYGMQAAIYSGEFDKLYDNLSKIKEQLMKRDRFKDYGAVVCAMAVLNVFVVTRRLTIGLNDTQFGQLYEMLEIEYEKDIEDNDLKTWCKIFRKDKLELCFELYAKELQNPKEKIEYYYEALKLCHEILDMINLHITKNEGNDANYSLIYQAFANRNISQIHKFLIDIEPEKADEHLALQKDYCFKTYMNRKELYTLYKSGIRENSIAMDFISQEYYLSLVEQYQFEENIIEKKRMKVIAKTIHDKLEDHARVQNMILQSVKNQNAEFLLNN